MIQQTDEWFIKRLGKPTASRYSDILARTKTGYSASRKNYLSELVIENLTGERKDFSNASMEWGVETEELARLRYELKTGQQVEQTGFWEHETLLTGASPDGLVGEDGLIEIKCPNTATHIETLKRKEIPAQYMAQVQGQMWITRRKWCDFVSFDPRLPKNAQLFIKRVPRDDEYIKALEYEVRGFLMELESHLEFVRGYDSN